MRLPLKKCIHLMVILLALIETFTGAIVDCVVYTIFYPSSLDHDGSSTSDYYFTAHLLPTKHFYRLIIVLYVPILYLWRSNGVCRLAEVSYNVSARSAYGSSRVISVICTRLPRSILPATAGWLWHWLRALQSTDADVQLADSSDADCNSWLRNPAWYENRKSWGALIHYSGQQHNSVIKQYNTRFALYQKLPWKYISRVYGKLTVREMPVWLRSPCFRLYIWFFHCRLEEAAVTDLRQYRSLSEFFRRSLQPGIRPVATASELTCPADGLIVLCGEVVDGELEQIKGVTYSLQGFIGPQSGSLYAHCSAVEQLGDLLIDIGVDGNGNLATSLLTCPDNLLYQCVVYLSPGEYHHFHSPADWVVTGRRHFPGELFSVNPGIVRWLQGLFNFNERVMYVGNWKHGFFSLTAIGATLVGSVNVHFDKELSTNEATAWPSCYFYDQSFIQTGEDGIRLNKGEEMGDFRLGSTIVLLFEAPPNFQFGVDDGQKVKYGEALTSVNN